MGESGYHPFGMMEPGRRYVAGGGYRYGFNGKENDNDVKGEGNQQDYGMRIYDPRIGKFLSTDPIANEFPWNSPYAFAENDIIRNIDLDGLEKASPSFVEMARKWRNFHGKNYLALKNILSKTTDNDIRANLQKAMDYHKRMYAQLVKGIYTNRSSDVEKSIYYLNRGTETAIEVGKIVGDITPLGDIKVLITGKDFHNQPQSRVAAAGWLILDCFGGEAISMAGKAGKFTMTAMTKGLTYANKYGKCSEFVTEFTTKLGRALKNEGAEINIFTIDIGKNGLIGTAKQGLSNNGMHEFVEVIKDGKSMVFDNMHPEGMLKDDYIKAIGGKTSEHKTIEGPELIKNYATQKK